MDRSGGHTPVLRDEVVQLLLPAERKTLVDCTIGLGGHAEALLQAAGQDALLIGLDVDPSNLAFAKQRLSKYVGQVRLFQANFRDLPDVLEEVGLPCVDALLADLGVASTQLDDPSRGFSFLAEGPLDMRMDRSCGPDAADLVNTLEEKKLADVIYQYGEERYSRRIARAIVWQRVRRRIETTAQLAAIVRGAYPAAARRSRRGVDPATRTFQAIRIAVNDELGSLECLLDRIGSVLATGGRAAVISFHSLEDRRVKHAFAELAETGKARRLTKKPVVASQEEIRDNPRSRSAKLRAIERIA